VNASAFLYRYFDQLPAAGCEWAYGDHAAAGFIPTNDATCVFVSTTPTRLRSLRRAGAEQAFNELLASAAPAFIDRLAAGTPTSPMRGFAGGPPAPKLGTWLGDGRRRRLLQRPNHHARDDRRTTTPNCVQRQCSLGTPDAMNSPPSPRTNAHGIGYPRHDQRHRGSRRVRLEPGSSTPPAPRGQLGDGRGN